LVNRNNISGDNGYRNQKYANKGERNGELNHSEAFFGFSGEFL
jgi:hypothetical protein